MNLLNIIRLLCYRYVHWRDMHVLNASVRHGNCIGLAKEREIMKDMFEREEKMEWLRNQ